MHATDESYFARRVEDLRVVVFFVAGFAAVLEAAAAVFFAAGFAALAAGFAAGAGFSAF